MIRGRVLAQFPVSVSGQGAVSVTKENGVWTIQLDEAQLSETAPTGLFALAVDRTTGVWSLVDLGAFALAE